MKYLLSLLIGFVSTLAAGAAHPPNFVIINIDDLGYADIAPFGSKLNETPHLARMAKEGRKLTSFYAAPVCSPSRASLMTGCYPKRVLPIPGVLFPSASVGLNPDEVTIAEVLQDAGYATACVGKWHLGDQPPFLPTSQGFDSYLGIPYSNDMGTAEDGTKSNLGAEIPKRKNNNRSTSDGTGLRGMSQPPLPLVKDEKVIARVKQDQHQAIVETYTTAALEFIRDHKDERFFLYFPHSAVHFPLYPGKSWVGKSGHDLYSDWVEEVDWSVGQVLDTLRELNLDQNTLVIFTSDNGGTARGSNAPLRGFKGSTWEGGVRTVTIAWWPGQIPAGTETDEITSMFDLLPTFASLGGAELPDKRKIDGMDISPLLLGQLNASGHETFFYYRGLNLQAVRSGPWKLHFGRNVQRPNAARVNPAAPPIGLQLFHLTKDIGETTDVAEKNPDVVQRLTDLAVAMEDDLGRTEEGPGVRPLGRVADAQPFIDHDGNVRAGAVATQKRFP